MWTAKLEMNGKQAFIGSKAKKHNVSIYGYPVSASEKQEGIYVNMVGFVSGNNREEFIKDIQTDKRVLNLDGNKDFFIGQVKEPLALKSLYIANIVHLEPVIITNAGKELLHIGSWNRKDLTKFIELITSKYDGKILKVKQQKVTDFSVTKMRPELTDKQKEALELAISEGYYEYPRKIELKKLAKLSDLSYSTYQAHLRKAEKKLLPFYARHMSLQT